MHIEFSSSPNASLGVEWELQVVDPQTRGLVNAASEMLAEMAGPDRDEHPKAKHELFETTVEIITGVCQTVPEAMADLAGTVAELTEVASRRGLALACAGSHPTAHWTAMEVSPNERYHRLVQDMQWMARRLLIFGVHVHVGVRSPAKAVPVVNALTAYVPHFLALSASSPYWESQDTGLASARSKVFESLPTAGLPEPLDDWEQFERFMGTLVTAGTIETVREVWWDIRPHPDFGTVELRVCDGISTLAEVGAVAALTQCLVHQLDTQIDRGYQLPKPSTWVTTQNKWRAARYGLDARVIVDEQGTTRPVRDLLAELVEDLRPVARRLGCETELASVLDVLERGASYERQRAVAASNDGDLDSVVDLLLREFASGRPEQVPGIREVAVGGAERQAADASGPSDDAGGDDGGH